jgi:hypothetical protein
MSMSSGGTRRALLFTTATAAGWLAATACGGASRPARAAPETTNEKAEEGVSANEDLMREHGVLDRLVLAYASIVREVEEIEKTLGIYELAQFTPGAAGTAG